MPIILVGNKIDNVKRRYVTEEDGMGVADKYSIRYRETSAKTGEGVSDMFGMIAWEML